MTWHLTGEMIEACSCKSACPCALGPAEPDQGWCSGALTFVIQEGQSEGVDLAGRIVVWLIDLPKDFASGEGTVRIYIDDTADARQQTELEAIFMGKKGGPGEVLASLVTAWLPTRTAPITIEGDTDPSITLGTIGQAKLTRISDESGRPTSLFYAPVLGAVQIERADLARSDGARFADPEMRAWDSGGHGSLSPFSWKA